MPYDADLAIIGGGLSGLSLARRLAVAPEALRVTVIEPRTSYSDDRTWCFWRPIKSNLPDTQARWRKWTFSRGGDVWTHESVQNAYVCLSARSVYDDALRVIGQSDRVALSLGVRAQAVWPDRQGALIETDIGALRARFVVDTRPDPTVDWVLLQAFAGAEIETDSDVFDPECVTLMGDMTADAQGFGFTYILPFSPRRALIEPTRFSLTNPTDEELDEDLARTIAAQAGGASVRILRRERGRLPMGGLRAPPLGPVQVVSAGVGGGALRAATGYGYERIQSWAARCADALLRGEPPIAHPRERPVLQAMDALFLRVIRRDPTQTPALFAALAAKVKPDALVRFLSGRPLARDIAQIVCALPSERFLHELVRTGETPLPTLGHRR